MAFALLEQPEDLGATSYGPRAGWRPASMWQWPQRDKILGYSGFKTFSFHQGNLGASYPKPTRSLVKTTLGLPPFCHLGVPTFYAKGYYTGPLPMAKGMGSIRARQSTGPFKPSDTEKWPAKVPTDSRDASDYMHFFCYVSCEGVLQSATTVRRDCG